MQTKQLTQQGDEGEMGSFKLLWGQYYPAMKTRLGHVQKRKQLQT